MATRSRSKGCLLLFLLSIVGFCFSIKAPAQVTTGTISGIVADSTGAIVPNATVTVRHMATGTTRTAITDEAGRYRVSQLPLGDYEVEGSAKGFQTAVRKGITLTVGREAVINLSLQIGAVSEKVEVTGEAPMVETTSASMAYLVDDKKIRDLPLNGRNYTQLALLQPGVSAFYQTRSDNSVGHGTVLTISGSQMDQNSFLLDGQDINDYAGRTPGSAAANNLGIDAIREFSIGTGNYTAEYGLVSGGVMNVVTRTGTNELHGSVFEFLRNSALDAKNFFDPALSPIPAYKRNQFGGTVGGPIKKDRTFFLGAYEGLRQRQALTLLSPTPNLLAHQGFLPTPGGGTTFVGVAPAMALRMSLMPLPNGRDFGDGTGQYVGNPVNPSDEDYVLGRVDHKLSDKDSLYGRYVYDNGTTQQLLAIPIFAEDMRTRFQYVTLNWARVASPNLVNEVRLGYNRSFGAFSPHQLVDVPAAQLAAIVGRPDVLATPWSITSPSINTGVGGGQFVETPRRFVQNIIEAADNVSYTRGKHSFRAGAIFKRYIHPAENNFGWRGSLAFANLQNFMLGLPLTLSGQVADSQLTYRQSLFGWYLQDDIRVNRRLTVNVGLRHEFTSSPSEDHNRSFTLKTITDNQIVFGPFFHTTKDNFAPRAGLAWDITGDGKMAFRAGAGVFYDQLVPTVIRYTAFPMQPRFTLAAPAFNPVPLVADITKLPAAVSNPVSWQFNPDLPTRYQWSADLSREILGGTTVKVAYLGARATHLEIQHLVNPNIPTILAGGVEFFPTTTSRINPNFVNITGVRWEGTGLYNSLQLSGARRFSHGLQYQVSYTYSRNLDLQSGDFGLAAGPGGAGGAIMDPYNLARDWGLSSYDVRHLFSTNLTYDIPLGNGLTGAPAKIAKGWQINGLLTLRTGPPLNITNGFLRDNNGDTGGANDRPNLAPGANDNPVSGTTAGCTGVAAGQKLGTPNLYFDPCAFQLQPAGFYGNLGRNTLIGPGLANFDLSLAKAFAFTERTNLQFRAEFFNLLNHPNFGDMFRTLYTGAGTGTGARNGSVGQIFNTTVPSRQIQFGLKFSF